MIKITIEAESVESFKLDIAALAKGFLTPATTAADPRHLVAVDVPDHVGTSTGDDLPASDELKPEPKKRGRKPKAKEPEAPAEDITFDVMRAALFEVSKLDNGAGASEVATYLGKMAVKRVKEIPEDKYAKVHAWAVERAAKK